MLFVKASYRQKMEKVRFSFDLREGAEGLTGNWKRAKSAQETK